MKLIISISENKILNITKKEWDRFFYDKRMVIGALILPFVLLYLVYSFVAPIMIDFMIGRPNNNIVFAINPPSSLEILFKYAGININQINKNEETKILDGISKKDGNILLIFPENFDNKVKNYELSSGEKAPEIHFYYNSLSVGFIESFTKINSILNSYEKSISKKFDINISIEGDMANSKETGGYFLSTLIPMFLLVFIYHGAVAATTESITGEKERGTLSTILITPISTIELAIGKILGIGIEAFLCGLSGTLGIILSIPKFIESLNSKVSTEHDLSILLGLDNFILNQYNIVDFIALVLVLLSCSFFIVSIISIVSINAKCVKEAQMLLAPMLILIMLISLISTLDKSGNQKNIYYSLFPIFNTIQSMNAIFSHIYKPMQITLTIIANSFFICLFTFLLSHLFTHEKIIATI